MRLKRNSCHANHNRWANDEGGRGKGRDFDSCRFHEVIPEAVIGLSYVVTHFSASRECIRVGRVVSPPLLLCWTPLLVDLVPPLCAASRASSTFVYRARGPESTGGVSVTEECGAESATDGLELLEGGRV